MFGMEIHEDTTQSRRQAPIMGIAGWSAANPPRRTVLIPVREYEMRARPVRSGWSRVPGHARAVSPWVSPYTAPAPGGRGGVGATRRDLRVPPPTGRGRAPSPVPTPQSDFHHGPLPGASLGNRSLSCVQPLALPHEFSRAAFRAKDAKGAYRPATELRVLRLLRARDRRSRQRTLKLR